MRYLQKKQNKKTICLTMMVKNEAHIICRCLESVADHIDYWLVCDTGSTDGTQEIVKDFFQQKGIPGELHQHQWINYGENRSLTLQVAKKKADYLLLADADYVFHFQSVNFRENLKEPAYYYFNISDPLKYKMLKLLRADKEWRYVGVTHEYIECVTIPDLLHKVGTLDCFYVEEMNDGGNRADKFTNDIFLLRKALKADPSNLRNIFYLARSYEDTCQYEKAIKFYQKRIAGGGWEEENYYSRFAICRCLIMLGKPFGEILEAAFDAYEYRPVRIESIYLLVNYCRESKKYHTGYLLGRCFVDFSIPQKDILFIHHDIYLWKLKDEVAVCAYWAGAYKESYDWNLELLNLAILPLEQKERIQKNFKFAKNMCFKSHNE
jgi:glycosyltransferase involved in cell wall biosynthesis